MTPITSTRTRTGLRGTALLLLLLTGSAVLWTGCSSPSSSGTTGADTAASSSSTSGASTSSASQRGVPVEIHELEPRTFRDVIKTTGTVEALHDATISAEVGGRVESIAARGETVAQGERVAGINDRLLQTSLESARAQHRLARETFQRQEALYRDSIISAAEYDNALAQRDQAEAQLEQAREQLDNARPRSPFAGRIEERFVEQGEYVSPGQALVRVVNTNRVKVTAGVPERYMADVREGSEVDVRFRSSRDSLVRSTVTFAGRTVDADSRTFPIEIALSNSGGMLAPAMIADLFITRTVLQNVLVVPQSAIVRDESDQPSVFVVDRSGEAPVALQRPVSLGPSANGLTVVESGLREGDELLVAGQSQVTDGDPIRITDRQQLAPGPDERGGLPN